MSEQPLSLAQLEETAAANIKSLLISLREKPEDEAAFNAVAGLLRGENAFNVTKAGEHRANIEHVSKHQRPNVHIVNENGSRLSKADYNDAIYQFVLYKSMLDCNINGMEKTMTVLLAGQDFQKRPLCTNKNHGLL